jgi:Fur family peroxide stress response transcriptional regulator
MNDSGSLPDNHLNRRLANSGFRFTPHRQHVYDVLLRHRDHPTAEEVFIRTKHDVPEISMATVYNCLDALVKSGLVRLVNLDRGATRFCPNMEEHGHFVCEICGAVVDIEVASASVREDVTVPPGFKAKRYDVSIHGECPTCSERS